MFFGSSFTIKEKKKISEFKLESNKLINQFKQFILNTSDIQLINI